MASGPVDHEVPKVASGPVDEEGPQVASGPVDQEGHKEGSLVTVLDSVQGRAAQCPVVFHCSGVICLVGVHLVSAKFM